MRNLKRNLTEIYYKMYQGEKEILDDEGYRTGEYTTGYSELRSCRISVSGNKGNSENEQFGKNLDYDRTMITADMDCEIDEHSVLWIDTDVDGPYNFIVKKRSVTFNQIQFAIKQVDVNETNNSESF